MGVARPRGTHGTRAHVVNGIVGTTVAIIVCCRGAVSRARIDGSDTRPEHAARTALRALLADPDIGARAAGARIPLDATAAFVDDSVAVGIISAHRARVYRRGEHCAHTGAEGTSDAGARASLTDTEFGVWSACARVPINARATAVGHAIAVRVVAVHGARILWPGPDRALAGTPGAGQPIWREHTSA